MHITNHQNKRREKFIFIVLPFLLGMSCAVAEFFVLEDPGTVLIAMVIMQILSIYSYGIGFPSYDISTEGIVVTLFGRFKRKYRWDEFLEIGVFRVRFSGNIGSKKPQEWLICSVIPIKKTASGDVLNDWLLNHPFKIVRLTNLTIEQEKQFYSFIPRS